MDLECLDFDFQVSELAPEAVEAPLPEGCLVHGLFIEGACWDPQKRTLAEARPHQNYAPFPMLALRPVLNRKPPVAGVYVCPCYKTVDRIGDAQRPLPASYARAPRCRFVATPVAVAARRLSG